MPDRRGPRLGVDLGTVRTGVAISDPDGLVATPLQTVARQPDDGLPELVRIIADRGVVEVVVGLPVRLSGEDGPAALAARKFSERLAGLTAGVPVRLADERLTTAGVSRQLSRSGVSTRRQRPMIDQAAAVVILQGWLDRHRGGDAAG